MLLAVTEVFFCQVQQIDFVQRSMLYDYLSREGIIKSIHGMGMNCLSAVSLIRFLPMAFCACFGVVCFWLLAGDWFA